MEILRYILWGALFFFVFLIWDAWKKDYPQTVTQPTPMAAVNQAIALPTTATRNPTAQQAYDVPAPIIFETDVFKGIIDLRGGHLIQLHLLNYPQEKATETKPAFALLDQTTDRYYIAQTDWIDLDKNQENPHLYTSHQTHYCLSPDQDTLSITLTTHTQKHLLKKQFTFKRGSYQVKVDYHIQNRGTTPWQGRLYAQLQRQGALQNSGGLFSLPSYTGGIISSDHKPYEKISFEKMGRNSLNIATQQGWIAFVERYFLSAWIVENGLPFQLYSNATQDNQYNLGVLSQPLTIKAGQSLDTTLNLYVGPTLIEQLQATAKNLDLTVDYGMLWFISTSLFWLLKQFHSLLRNWGWAIIAVTVLIKLAFYSLSAKSFRSMMTMRNLQPKLQALKTRYGNDRQKIAQATMELYRKEQVSLLGGCLPMLVQIPVFIALYWVLLESVELRQAPFTLWIHDLSTKDPLYILPLLMGISMFLQQKLSPPPADPTQAKVMLLLPVFFTFIFLNFPAGLVLYWLINNTLSILQQWWMMRNVKEKKALIRAP
jgi:YidC/Oxa1 family membrane protein insertase